MPRPIAFPIKKLVHLTDEQAEAIANYRFSKRIASENEAIRRLIELGLQAVKLRNGSAEVAEMLEPAIPARLE